jgi:hypothetical protein
MVKRKGEVVVYCGIIAFMIWVIVWSLVVMDYFESKFLPILVSSGVLGLAVIGLAKELLQDKVDKVQSPKKEARYMRDKVQWRRMLPHGAWVLGLALGIYILGYIVITPLFLIAYMRWLKVKWRTIIIDTVLVSVIIYFVFQFFLKVELYPGLLFKWFDVRFY